VIGQLKEIARLRLDSRQPGMVFRCVHPSHDYEIVYVLQNHKDSGEALDDGQRLIASAYRTFLLEPRVFERGHVGRECEVAVYPPGSGFCESVVGEFELSDAGTTNYEEGCESPSVMIRAQGQFPSVSMKVTGPDPNDAYSGRLSFSPMPGSRACACGCQPCSS